MSKTRPPVSLVIAAYHRPDSLDRLLTSIDLPDTEVIVAVVDGDPSVEAVAQRYGARTVDVPGNPGFAAAVNRGIALAAGDILAIANDDLELRPGALAALAHAVVETGGLAVPQLLDREGAVQPSIAALATPGSLLLEWALLPDRPLPPLPRRLAAKWRQPAQRELVPAAMAALVAGPAEVLRRTPLPECYFLYWEEQEWYWTLRQQGIALSYEPAAQVVHDGGRDDVRGDKSALLATNALRYLRRTQGRWAAMRAWPVVVLWWSRLVALDGLRALTRPSEPARRRVVARWTGLRAALRGVAQVAAR
jgi:GT2 family glycosyltransferase